MERVSTTQPGRVISGGRKKDSLTSHSHFVVRNSCGAPAKASWLSKEFQPRSLTVFFKKLDPEAARGAGDADTYNNVEFIDNTSGTTIPIDLMTVPEECCEASYLPGGINSTVLVIKYLKEQSDDAAESAHRLDLKPGEVRIYDFAGQGAGTYLVFFGIECGETQGAHWYFRRVSLARHKSYEITFRQEAGKLSGVSKLRKIAG